MDSSFNTADSSFYSCATGASENDWDDEEEQLYQSIPIWPSNSSARPPVASLIKQNLPSIRPPPPLLPEYQSDLTLYDEEITKKNTRLKAAQDTLVVIKKELDALPPPSDSTATRTWSSKTNSNISAQRRVFLQEKLTKENDSLLAIKKEIAAFEEKYATVLELRKLHTLRHILYNENVVLQGRSHNFDTPVFAGSASLVQPVKEEAWQLALRATALY